MYFCASVKSKHLGIRSDFKSNETKKSVCKMKFIVSTIKTTFLLAS